MFWTNHIKLDSFVSQNVLPRVAASITTTSSFGEVRISLITLLNYGLSTHNNGFHHQAFVVATSLFSCFEASILDQALSHSPRDQDDYDIKSRTENHPQQIRQR